MNFSLNPGQVRCDRFKPGGKWYDSFELDMSNLYGFEAKPGDHSFLTLDAVIVAISEACPGMVNSDTDWIYVVMEPYHKHAFPIMVRHNEIVEYLQSNGLG